ncbi:MAG: hypothetical protein FWF10_07935 [Clostridiales bacterium]|nr:hypothetical protein [Clostridiales bacterium]
MYRERKKNPGPKIILVTCMTLIWLLIIFLFMNGSATYDPYYDWPSVHTQAINSLLGISNTTGPNTILQMEEDDFGRKMYVYYHSPGWDPNREWLMAILIEQKSDRKNVYYYPDYSFIVHPIPDFEEIWDDAYEEEYDQLLHDAQAMTPKETDVLEKELRDRQLVKKAREILTEEAIDELKVKNNWNKPIDDSKFIKNRHPKLNRPRRKPGKLVPIGVLREVYYTFYPNKGNVVDSYIEWNYDYLTSDDYGRHIFFLQTEDDDRNVTNSYVILFHPDNTYDIAEITDIWNYQDELKAFKERNGWNKPQ